ncbi:hypothetical protein HDV00_012626 [Rhizophlyctis rosea]|nr:hypothetical protein HDV00_012626 [Rhizophlyctis rosea]
MVEYRGVVMDAFLFRAVRTPKDRLFLLKLDSDCQGMVESPRPTLRLKDIPVDESASAQHESTSLPAGAVKIMQRRDHHHRSHRNGGNDSGSDTSSKPKTIEEREAAYLAARARIFQEDAASDGSKDSQDSSKHSARPVSPSSSLGSSESSRQHGRQHGARKGPSSRKFQPLPRSAQPNFPQNHASFNPRQQHMPYGQRQPMHQPMMNGPYMPGTPMPFYPFPSPYAGPPSAQPSFPAQSDPYYEWQQQYPPGPLVANGYGFMPLQQAYGIPMAGMPYPAMRPESGPWPYDAMVGMGGEQRPGPDYGQSGAGSGEEMSHGSPSVGPSGRENNVGSGGSLSYVVGLSIPPPTYPSGPPQPSPSSRPISEAASTIPYQQSPLHPQYASNFPSLPTATARPPRPPVPPSAPNTLPSQNEDSLDQIAGDLQGVALGRRPSGEG